MAELKWEVISIKDGCVNEECDWVEVDPLTGGTTTNPKITVNAATSEDDCGRATIVFSSSTSDEYYVSVVRCIPESDCENCKTKQTLSNTDGTVKTRTQIGTYEGSSSNMDITVDGIVLLNGEIGNDGKIYADISENKVGTRTGWYKILYEGVECGSKKKIIQSAIEQKCGQDTDCDVDPWYRPITDPEHPGGTIVAEGGNVYVWISKCWDVNSAAYDAEIISEITTYEEKDTEEYAAYVIKVKTNTGNDRSFSVDFNLTNHDTQEKCDGNHIVQMVQAGGGTPPTPTDCTCSITSEYNNVGNAYSKDGSTEKVQVGKITYLDGCTSTTFREIEIRDGGSRSIWNSASDFDIKDNGEVWAQVPANNTTSVSHIRVYFNCKKENIDEYDYFNFYQAAGTTPTTDNCSKDDLNCFIKAFNDGATFSKNISETGTPKTYTYLEKLYTEAYKQFYNVSEGRTLDYIYKEENLPNIYNDMYGNDNEDEDKLQAFNAMVGFLFAMALTEIRPDQASSKELYTVGYNMGSNNRTDTLYGKYAFHSDPNVARLMGSIVFAGLRPNNSQYINKINEMRSEIGGSNFNYTVNQYRNSEGGANWDDIIITKDALNEFFPMAPGPYGPNNVNDPNKAYPNDGKDDKYNLLKDDLIYRRIVGGVSGYEPYILTNTTNSARTAQAIADKEVCPNHLFGASRTVTVDNVVYTINPVFNHNITTYEKLGTLAESVGRIAEDSRYAGSRTKGRYRPGRNSGGYANGKFLCNSIIEYNDGCILTDYDENGNRISVPTADNYCDDDYNRNKDSEASFPSGHSARMWAVTLMLINLHPDKVIDLMKEGYQYTVNRTITRYHWNSDIINGRIIGGISYPILCATKDYNILLSQCEWHN